MGKAFVASACGLLVLLSGCGSSKSDDLKTACAKTVKAQQEYRTAGGKVGLDFYNRAADLRLIATIHTFRAQIKRLAPLTAKEQRRPLEGWAVGLTQQENVFHALAAHDEAEAQKLAGRLNEPALDAGRKALETACRKSA
jgi:hypothetical protein